MANRAKYVPHMKRLLNSADISESDIASLCETVAGARHFRNRRERIDAILRITNHPEELLKRKKMTRDILFSHAQDLGLRPGVKTTKSELIQMLIDHWDGLIVSKALASKSSASARQRPPTTELQVERYDRPFPSANVVPASYSASSPSMPFSPQQPPQPGPVAQPSGVLVEEGRQLAERFLDEFYRLFVQDPPGFNESHFFSDAQLTIRNDNMNTAERLISSSVVAQRMNDIKLRDSVILAGNSIEGVASEHGMLLVHARGMLHRYGTVIGIFEQRFALAPDPTIQNNYRIKWTDILLRMQ